MIQLGLDIQHQIGLDKLDAALAVLKADRGIERSAKHAEKIDPGWHDKAIGYVRLHAMVNRTFLTEDVREMAEADGLVKPPDGRAWGHVMRAAARKGIVKAFGYAPARSSNMSPKVLWKALAA